MSFQQAYQEASYSTNNNSGSDGFWNKFKSSIPIERVNSYIRINDPESDLEAQERASAICGQLDCLELSRWDRILISGACIAGSVACFVLCFFLFPVLALKPTKFALLWTLGSIFFLLSWGFMQGFAAFGAHLVSPSRRWFSLAYISSIILTLYFSLGLKSSLLTLLSAIFQLLACIYYTVSYFPFGTQGLNLISNIGVRQATSWFNE